MKISMVAIREWFLLACCAVIVLMIALIYWACSFLAWIRIPYFKKALHDIEQLFEDFE